MFVVLCWGRERKAVMKVELMMRFDKSACTRHCFGPKGNTKDLITNVRANETVGLEEQHTTLASGLWPDCVGNNFMSNERYNARLFFTEKVEPWRHEERSDVDGGKVPLFHVGLDY